MLLFLVTINLTCGAFSSTFTPGVSSVLKVDITCEADCPTFLEGYLQHRGLFLLNSRISNLLQNGAQTSILLTFLPIKFQLMWNFNASLVITLEMQNKRHKAIFPGGEEPSFCELQNILLTFLQLVWPPFTGAKTRWQALFYLWCYILSSNLQVTPPGASRPLYS